ncbi:hypothetical protein [Oerskovia enterophila]|nr:hypothetical protein [Oerskovia enterophila]
MNLSIARWGLNALTTLRALDGRTSDEHERTALEQWGGWGPLTPAFETFLAREWMPVTD